MKKSTYLATVVLAITSTSWAADQCVPWDYARIKEASQDELVQMACNADKKAMDNLTEAMDAIATSGQNWKAESDAAKNAKAVCDDQSSQAKKVLREKFGKHVTKADCGAR